MSEQQGSTTGAAKRSEGLRSGFEAVFGVPHPKVNAFSVSRRERGRWIRMIWDGGNGIGEKEWPLADLSPDLVRTRWGEGEYRCTWFTHDPEHRDPAARWTSEGHGKPFVIRPLPAAAPPPPPPAPPPADPYSALPGFGQAMAFMNLIDQRTTSQMAGMAQFAQIMMGAARPAGPDPTLTRILERQQEQLDRIERAMEADEEPAPSTAQAVVPAAVAVARRAAPLFKKGEPISEGLVTAVANHLAENPDKLVALVQAVPAALEAIGKLTNKPKPPRLVLQREPTPPPAAAAPSAPPPPPAPKPRPLGPGLNAHANALPKSQPPPAPVQTAAGASS